MKKYISMLLLCAVPIFAMAQDFTIVAQPVICMIQSDAGCGIVGGPVTVVHNEDDIIVRGGVCFVLTEKDDATGVENITEDDNNVKPGMKYFFSLDGKQFSAPQKRLNIQKMTDGTTRKIVIK